MSKNEQFLNNLDRLIKDNLLQIFKNRPDLGYALAGTRLFDEHVSGGFNFTRRDYLRFLIDLNFNRLNKIKPFD